MKGPDRVIACLTALAGRRCDPSAGQVTLVSVDSVFDLTVELGEITLDDCALRG